MKPTTLVSATAELFRESRRNITQGIKNLWEIRDKGLWSEVASSFTEYVEQECQLDKGQVSRWLTVYEHYVLSHGVELAQLEDINPERLYIARQLKGSVETQLISAEKLNRSQLNAELAVKENGEEHDHVPITICQICHIRL